MHTNPPASTGSRGCSLPLGIWLKCTGAWIIMMAPRVSLSSRFRLSKSDVQQRLIVLGTSTSASLSCRSLSQILSPRSDRVYTFLGARPLPVMTIALPERRRPSRFILPRMSEA